MTRTAIKTPAKDRKQHRDFIAVIPETYPEKRFRDDGLCPECFAELEHEEGMSACHLCGYYECD